MQLRYLSFHRDYCLITPIDLDTGEIGKLTLANLGFLFLKRKNVSRILTRFIRIKLRSVRGAKRKVNWGVRIGRVIGKAKISRNDRRFFYTKFIMSEG